MNIVRIPKVSRPKIRGSRFAVPVSKFINLDPRVCGRASLVILLFLLGDLRTRMTTLDEFLSPTEAIYTP